jgi:VanZ family protein
LRTAIRWLPALAWMALIFWLSSGPLPPTPGGIDIPDKIAHFIAYAILSGLSLWAAAALSPDAASLVAFVVAVAYGASDEFHQHFVPGRSADVRDWLTDVAGAAFAVGIIALLKHRRAPPDSHPRR